MIKDKILIIGTLPETSGIGGVTIHIKRLLEWLKSEGMGFEFVDYRSSSLICHLKAIWRYRLLHLHISNPFFRLLYILVARCFWTRVIMTLHGNLGRHSRFGNFIDRLTIRFCTVPILLNEESYNKALRINKKAELISAFLPPDDNGFLPDWVKDRIRDLKSSGMELYATNASTRSFTSDGREIYGIDFLTGFFKSLDNKILIISDPSGKYSQFYNQKELFFIIGNHSFFELLKLVDAFIRDTATDGDSLSVREALYLGVPVLATDVVPRPRGVIEFKYNDSSSLEIAISKIKNYPKSFVKDNPIGEIVRTYKKYMS